MLTFEIDGNYIGSEGYNFMWLSSLNGISYVGLEGNNLIFQLVCMSAVDLDKAILIHFLLEDNEYQSIKIRETLTKILNNKFLKND